jgi:hypothetical protein
MRIEYMKTVNKMLALSALLATSCQSVESTLVDEIDDNLPVNIVAKIGNLSAAANTRYAGDDVNSLSFQSGDKIGMFVNKVNCTAWTLGTSNTWAASSTVYWEDVTSEHRFDAFYPYADGASHESVPVPALQSQSGAFANLDQYDFMVATANSTYTANNGVVKFTDSASFQHKLSLLVLTFSAKNDLQGVTLNSLTLKADNLTKANTYSFSDDTFSPVDVEDEADETALTKAGDEQDATANTDADNVLTSATDLSIGTTDQVLYYVLNPVTSAITLTIHYTKNEVAYTASATLSNVKIESGKKYTSTISVNNNTVSISDASISAWTDGTSLGNHVMGSQKDE